MEINMSICTYANGEFDIIINDQETHEEQVFSGKLNQFQIDNKNDLLEFTSRVAPACVFTKYKRLTPKD